MATENEGPLNVPEGYLLAGQPAISERYGIIRSFKRYKTKANGDIDITDYELEFRVFPDDDRKIGERPPFYAFLPFGRATPYFGPYQLNVLPQTSNLTFNPPISPKSDTLKVCFEEI